MNKNEIEIVCLLWFIVVLAPCCMILVCSCNGVIPPNVLYVFVFVCDSGCACDCMSVCKEVQAEDVCS